MESEKEGSRPARRVYEVTAAGRQEFNRLLMELWTDDKREFFPLDIGLFFLSELPEVKRLPLITGRIDGIRRTLAHLEKHQQDVDRNPHVPAEAGAIFSHTRHHLKAELAWLEEVKADVESGRIPGRR